MEKKGITKKQFWLQMYMVIFWVLYATFMIVNNVQDGDTVGWVLGTVVGVFYLSYGIYLIYLRKRYPVEDAQLDKQVGENFKTGMKGMGIVMGIISAGFLIAFAIAALVK